MQKRTVATVRIDPTSEAQSEENKGTRAPPTNLYAKCSCKFDWSFASLLSAWRKKLRGAIFCLRQAPGHLCSDLRSSEFVLITAAISVLLPTVSCFSVDFVWTGHGNSVRLVGLQPEGWALLMLALVVTVGLVLRSLSNGRAPSMDYGGPEVRTSGTLGCSGPSSLFAYDLRLYHEQRLLVHIASSHSTRGLATSTEKSFGLVRDY